MQVVIGVISMHPLAFDHLKKILEEMEIVGPDETCEYYPCHFIGQDCTWCFCPFYPCEDEETGGEWVRTKDGGRIWSCSNCYWVHYSDVAKAVMEEFKESGIDTVEDIEKRKRDLKRIFLLIKERYPPSK
jgi:Zn-finger protein